MNKRLFLIVGLLLSTLLLTGSSRRQMMANQVAGAAPTVETPDLLWWKMTNGSGTTVTAAVGPNGTTDADWTTGASGSGSALDNNGTSDNSTSSSTIAYATNAMTITAWIYLDATNVTDQIWETGGTGGGTKRCGLFLEPAVLTIFQVGADGGFRAETIPAPAPGSWFHIVCYYDAGSTSEDNRVWINGVEQSTTTGLNGIGDAVQNFTTGTFYLGARAGTSDFFGGLIDDVRIQSGFWGTTAIANVYADPQ